jgi:hypothetical protein
MFGSRSSTQDASRNSDSSTVQDRTIAKSASDLLAPSKKDVESKCYMCFADTINYINDLLAPKKISWMDVSITVKEAKRKNAKLGVAEGEYVEGSRTVSVTMPSKGMSPTMLDRAIKYDVSHEMTHVALDISGFNARVNSVVGSDEKIGEGLRDGDNSKIKESEEKEFNSAKTFLKQSMKEAPAYMVCASFTNSDINSKAHDDLVPTRIINEMVDLFGPAAFANDPAACIRYTQLLAHVREYVQEGMLKAAIGAADVAAKEDPRNVETNVKAETYLGKALAMLVYAKHNYNLKETVGVLTSDPRMILDDVKAVTAKQFDDLEDRISYINSGWISELSQARYSPSRGAAN